MNAGPSGAAGPEERLRDGTRILIRPIRLADIELERRFIESLSPGARRFRFLETMRSPSDALLKRLTDIDPATDAAYIAVIPVLATCDPDGSPPQAAAEQEIGVARFSAEADGTDCEFAVAVADAWQNKGLGSLLMRRLIAVARSRGINRMHAISAADNTLMRRLARHLRFQAGRDPDDAAQAYFSIDLNSADGPGA